MTLSVGVPTEIKTDERRVALTPDGVREMEAHGVEVLVQARAGEGASIPDDAYRAAGAEVVATAEEVWARAGMVVKVKEPQASEFGYLRPDLTLFTYLHLAAYPKVADALCAAGTTGIAYETVMRADGALPLLAPMSEVAGRLAVQAGARFLASMPDEARSAVGAYQNRQWHVASMILRCAGSPDLVGSNPALAYCLASAWVFRPQGMSWPMRSIRRILPKRRREIAGWLGFPATDAAVNILAKVPASACSIQRLLGLRTALTDATSIKWLSHAAVLHGPVLDLLTQKWFSQPCTPPFIREAARNWTTQDEGVRGMALLGDTFWMARRLGEIGGPRISSLRGLIREHDRLAVMERRRIRQEEDRAFPAPPFPGSPTIVPIRSVPELVREGEEQENCVAGYAHAVLQGRCFLYRVLAPERATLSLVNDGQQWRLGELALKQNGMSCGTTGQAVENWLQASSMCAVDADLSPF